MWRSFLTGIKISPDACRGNTGNRSNFYTGFSVEGIMVKIEVRKQMNPIAGFYLDIIELIFHLVS